MRFDNIVMKGRDGLLILPEFIGRAEFNNDASVSFSIASKYTQVLVFYTDIVPSIDGQNIRLRFSDDGGGSYYSTSGNYAFSASAISTVLAYEGSSSAAQIRLNTPQVGNAAGEGFSGWFFLNSLGGNTGFPTCIYRGVHQDSLSGPECVFGSGQLLASQSRITNFQIDFNSGNLATGIIAVYGIEK